MPPIVFFHEDVGTDFIDATRRADDSHKFGTRQLEIVLLTKLIKFLKMFAGHHNSPMTGGFGVSRIILKRLANRILQGILG